MQEHPLIIFDGICYLCEWYVLLVLRHDKKNSFRFSPFQSEYAQKVLLKYNTNSIASKTVILIEEEKIFVKSSAILEILKNLGGLWRILYIFKLVPAFLRDPVYDWIAKNRFAWFGRRDKCMVPDEKYLSRFLT